MSVFNINPDIRRAATLASDFYTDEKYFEQSKEKIFARSWQFLGDVEKANNLRPQTILEGFLDEPVLIARGENQLYWLSNVCTHRGKILVENACEGNLIRCSYHGRRFALNGKFLSMPEFERVENFPTECDDLPPIPFGVWENFLFAAINPLAPLESFIGEMRARLDWFDYAELKFVAAKDYLVRAHWALYCENYLEGFHVPFVHQSLNQAIDYGSYATELFPFASLQTALSEPPPASASGMNAAKTQSSKQTNPFEKNIAAFYFFIFPNLMFNFYPWGLSVNVVKPLKPDLTRVSYLTYVSDESKLNRGAGADLETVEMEDHAVVESVQKGIRSRFYSTGRYSPARELGTHHFHRLIAEFMS
jgi:choline monooxygenase